MLLNSLIANINDKENTNSLSFLQSYNTNGGKSDNCSNALYEFLKNKHLNIDHLKRPSND